MRKIRQTIVCSHRALSAMFVHEASGKASSMLIMIIIKITKRMFSLFNIRVVQVKFNGKLTCFHV